MGLDLKIHLKYLASSSFILLSALRKCHVHTDMLVRVRNFLFCPSHLVSFSPTLCLYEAQQC